MFKILYRDYYFFLGQKKNYNAELEKSIYFFDKAIALSPNYAGLYIQKARALVRMKKYDEAFVALEKAIFLEPGNTAPHLFLGIAYFDADNLEKASSYFEKALQLTPDNKLALCYKSLTSIKQKENIEDSYKLIKKNIDNTNLEFKVRLLFCCEEYILSYKKQARCLEEMLFHEMYVSRKKRNFIRLEQKLDHILYGIKILPFKVKYLFNPNKRKAYEYLFQAQKSLDNGELLRSESELQASVKIFPHLTEAKLTLIRLLFYQRKYKKIYDIISNMEEYEYVYQQICNEEKQNRKNNFIKNDDQFLIAVTLIQLFLHEGKYKKVINAISHLVGDQLSNDYYHQYYIGLSHLALNDSDLAIDYFKKSISLNNPNIVQKRLEEMSRLMRKNTGELPNSEYS